MSPGYDIADGVTSPGLSREPLARISPRRLSVATWHSLANESPQDVIRVTNFANGLQTPTRLTSRTFIQYSTSRGPKRLSGCDNLS